jgi:hypothetical protein
MLSPCQYFNAFWPPDFPWSNRSYREHPTAEAVHAVGPKGKPLVEEKGLEVALGDEVPDQLEHLLGLNEIRISIESGSVPVAFFITYLQLASFGWRHPLIPGAVLAVRAPTRRAFLIEYNRGTETLGSMQKLQSYDKGVEGFPFEAVLIVAERPRRFDLFSRELRKKGLALAVLAATLDEVKEARLLEAKLTELPGGGNRRLLGSQEGPEGEVEG